MKKTDIIFILKTVFIISSIPITFVCWTFSNDSKIKFVSSLLVYLLFTLFVFNIYLIKDMYENREYRKYGLENPDKNKINPLIIFISIYSVAAIPHLIIKPLMDLPVDPILHVGIFMLYIFLFFVYGGFVYKLLTELNKYGKKALTLKHKSYNYIDLIAYDIKRMKLYQKIITLNNHLIVINKGGIFEIIIVDGKGKFEGNIAENIFYYNGKEISNPFIVNKKNTNYFVILNGNISFSVYGVDIISKSGVNIAIDKKSNKEILQNNEIDQMCEEIKNEINDSNVKVL